jgi:uncharacterized protein (TIGR02246 family)
MSRRASWFMVGALALLTGGMVSTGCGQPPGTKQPAAANTPPANSADEQAIRKSAQEFSKAYEKGDAKAIAALWTEQGEMQDESGEMLRGRAAIETAFAGELKEHPGDKIDVLIESIHFPAKDLAIEEGVLRHTSAGKELPSSTRYSAVHVRDGGQWKMAISQEWGAGRDRLEDLDWLVGTWKAKLPEQEVTLTFAKDEKRPLLVGKFTRQAQGKPVGSGTMKISYDPRRGQLRSSHIDDDGGHGQAVWVRDGNNWLLEANGVTDDGLETAAVNILGRLNDNELTWRSTARAMGGQPMPDTMPIKLTRVSGK